MVKRTIALINVETEVELALLQLRALLNLDYRVPFQVESPDLNAKELLHNTNAKEPYKLYEIARDNQHRIRAQYLNMMAAEKAVEQGDSSSSVFEPKFALNNLRFANNSMRLITENYGEYTLEIPELTRSQLNGDGSGLTIGELGVAILQPILDEAENAAKKKLKKVAKREVEDKLKEKLEKSLDDEQKGAINKLKGLFGR